MFNASDLTPPNTSDRGRRIMLPDVEQVHVDEAFDEFLEAAWVAEDVRHGTDVGDADDSEGMPLSSQPPSPLTPLPTMFDSDVPNPDLDPIFLPPPLPSPSPPQSPLTPLTPLSAVDEPDVDIEPLTLADDDAAPTPPPATPLPTHVTPGPDHGLEGLRLKNASKKRRSKQRQKKAATRDILEPAAHAPKPSTVKKHQNFEKASVKFDATDLTVANGAWIGVRRKEHFKRPHTLRELRRKKFKCIRWNGEKTLVLVDRRGRIFVTFVARSKDAGWMNAITGVARAITFLREECLRLNLVKPRDLNHRRGKFLALASGVSFGGGQVRPGNVVHSKGLRRLLDQFLKDKNVIRVANFQSATLSYYAPKIYHYMRSTMQSLFSFHPGLRRNFEKSIFPMITINCGPATECLIHTDQGNGAGLQCVFTCIGNHNPSISGHVILYDLKTYVEFPSGTSCYLPSASLAHGNVPVRKGEWRYSMTQYCPGGLLRWVYYGFQSAKSLLARQGGKAEKARLDGPAGSRWKWSLGLFSKVDELAADIANTFTI